MLGTTSTVGGSQDTVVVQQVCCTLGAQRSNSITSYLMNCYVQRQNGGAKLLAPFESAKIKLQQAADAVATATAAGGSGAAILSALQVRRKWGGCGQRRAQRSAGD